MTYPKNLEIRVDGVPVAKGRPRATRAGRLYTPAKTRAAEDAFLAQALPQIPGMVPAGVPVSIAFRFTLPIPTSWSKKKKALAEADRVLPVGRPDTDNLVKLALDSLNGALYADDSQIVTLSAVKTYGENPETVVRMEAHE